MNRRDLLLTLCATASTFAAQRARRPNIVFILADDLGYGDLGCYGQKQIATPRIDELSRNGLRFTHAYAGSPVCAPSRCCLITGQHSGHGTIRWNTSAEGKRVPLKTGEHTLPGQLKALGYRTGMIGKWGLGEAHTSGIPTRQGFDEFFGYLNQDHALQHYPAHLWHNEQEVFPSGNQGGRTSAYAQDLFLKETLQFIENHKAQPFFLYLPYTLPHADSDAGRHGGVTYPVTENRYAEQSWPRDEQGYAAMVTRLDGDVGQIVDKLRALQLEDNTLIIFTSDNGPAKDGTHRPEFFGSSGALRGMKGQVYEGGVRVPTIASWKGKIAAGTTTDQPVAMWDWLPTLVGIAGGRAQTGIDGSDQSAVLRGGKRQGEVAFYWESHGDSFVQGARLGNYKGVRAQGRTEVYDLSSDPAEKRNLAEESVELSKRFQAFFDSARTPSPEFPPVREKRRR